MHWYVCLQGNMGAQQALVAGMQSLAAAGPVLLLVDNAEDAIVSGAQYLPTLLGQIAASMSNLKLLITSRMPLQLPQDAGMPGLTTTSVAAMEVSAAAGLLKTYAPKLAGEDAEGLARMCGGIPLVLKLAGQAAASNRLDMQVGRVWCSLTAE